MKKQEIKKIKQSYGEDLSIDELVFELLQDYAVRYVKAPIGQKILLTQQAQYYIEKLKKYE